MAVLESSMEEGKSPKYSPKNDKKILLLAQDLSYARNLASNEEKVRRRSIKYLKKYLEQRSQAGPLTEENLKVLWKGLFYAMWMSDKPLVQEECAENIAHLIHCLQFDGAMLFFKIGLLTLQNEWIGIDQLRVDKFLMFVRRLLRQALFVLKKVNFRKCPNEAFAKILADTILNVTQQPPLGLFMHFTEIYLEEVAKVADGKLQPSRTLDLIKPYISKLAFATDNRVVQWIVKFIFTHLMKQHKLGLEYEDKYKIWKMQGFKGSINQIQKIIVSDDEWDDDSVTPKKSLNTSLDPRAGRVDVELPQILFNAKEIAEALMDPKSDPRTSKNTRNHLSIWSDRYLKLHSGIYPLGIRKLVSKKRKNLDNYDTNVSKAAKKLLKFEEQLLTKDGKIKKKRGNSESESEQLDSVITKKNNLEMETESPSNKKKGKKEKDKLTKIGSKIELCGLEGKQTRKQDKKLKALESKKDDMKDELRKKIGEKKLKQRRNANKYRIGDVDYNYCFERNSGVWYVTPEIFKNVETSKSSSKQRMKREENNGNYEIFIPSRKLVKRLNKLKNDEEVEQVLRKIRGKSRTSINNLPSKKIQNEVTPWKQRLKLGSPKKVVINTKLNISQEIDDHILQVISSPQVPWDSSKKPGKPLLKTPIKASPINPFYRLKTF